VQDRDELRQHIVQFIDHRASTIGRDATALFPYAGLQAADDTSTRIIDLVIQLLLASTREARVETRSVDAAELRRIAREKRVPIAQLFGLVYLLERAVLDELALDESFGANSEPWPVIAQVVRRASFDLLAGFAEGLAEESGDEALVDRLTTLHTRAVLLAVLEKEIQRSERFGHPFALIVFDVDHFAAINAKHGYGVGDRVLERIGIIMRNYFREQDWVSRSAGDRFGVLLPETHAEHAEQLAERVRETVQERLSLRDHRSDEPVVVTVSAAVVIAEAVDANVRAEHLLKEAEQAVHRAKHGGRNRVERVEINVKTTIPPSRGASL